MKRFLIWLALFLSATILTANCAPLSEQPAPRRDFLAVCKAKAQEHGGKITREEFLGEALNKEQAEKVFDACDVKNHGYLTEEELFEPQKQKMIQEVIRLTEPGR